MRSRRLLFVLALTALAVAAVASGSASNAPSRVPANASVSTGAAVLTQSTNAWFCPGLPPALAHAAARVSFANIGDGSADVVVTDLADSGAATHLTFQLGPRAIVNKTRDQLGGPGALTIETFGGRVLVEEGIEGPGTLESVPCATQTSPHWYFAAGSTPRGVQQWLVIDNPYASDAKVDVTLRTSSGVRRPDSLQGLDIARRSREVVAIHDVAVRQARVAVAIDAEVGAVVAGQTLVYTPTAGRPGVALTIGSPSAATEWTFPGGFAQPGTTALVAIANVGNDAAQVDVQATAESSKQALAPAAFTVAQDDVVWVQFGRCAAESANACVAVPDGTRYSVDVRSEQNVPIVAQTLTRFAAAPGFVGAASTPGLVLPARSWAFARAHVNGEVTTTLSLFNPGARPSVVGIGLVRGGAIGRPAALQQVAVAPGHVVTVEVVGGAKPSRVDVGLTVDATEPVFAERTIVAADEVSMSTGVVVG